MASSDDFHQSSFKITLLPPEVVNEIVLWASYDEAKNNAMSKFVWKLRLVNKFFKAHCARVIHRHLVINPNVLRKDINIGRYLCDEYLLWSFVKDQDNEVFRNHITKVRYHMLSYDMTVRHPNDWLNQRARLQFLEQKDDIATKTSRSEKRSAIVDEFCRYKIDLKGIEAMKTAVELQCPVSDVSRITQMLKLLPNLSHFEIKGLAAPESGELFSRFNEVLRTSGATQKAVTFTDSLTYNVLGLFKPALTLHSSAFPLFATPPTFSISLLANVTKFTFHIAIAARDVRTSYNAELTQYGRELTSWNNLLRSMENLREFNAYGSTKYDCVYRKKWGHLEQGAMLFDTLYWPKLEKFSALNWEMPLSVLDCFFDAHGDTLLLFEFHVEGGPKIKLVPCGDGEWEEVA